MRRRNLSGHGRTVGILIRRKHRKKTQHTTRRLDSSPAGSNELHIMELSRAWEPGDSSGTSRFGEERSSRPSLCCGDED